MKNVFTALLLVTISSLSLNAQSWQFANSFGGESGSDPTNNNMPRNLVTDNNGNSYLFGTYGAGTAFNDSTLTHFIDGSRGSFVAKFDCTGQVSWSKAISNSEQSNDQACYMILKDEYLYLSGSCRIDNFYKTWFLDTLVIGSILVQDYPQNSIFPWIPYRNYSYLIKMDLQGNIIDYNLFSLYNDNIAKTNQIWYLWNNQTNQRAFAIDNEDNYYLLARLTNEQTSVLFHNEIPITDTISPIYENGYYQYYLLKLDQNFNFLWFKPIVYEINDPDNFSTSMDFLDMVCDSQNNLYMVGYLQTNNTLGTEPNPVEVDLGNGQHLETYMNDNAVGYLLKMNSDGEVLWTQQTKGYSEDGLLSNCFF